VGPDAVSFIFTADANFQGNQYYFNAPNLKCFHISTRSVRSIIVEEHTFCRLYGVLDCDETTYPFVIGNPEKTDIIYWGIANLTHPLRTSDGTPSRDYDSQVNAVQCQSFRQLHPTRRDILAIVSEPLLSSAEQESARRYCYLAGWE